MSESNPAPSRAASSPADAGEPGLERAGGASRAAQAPFEVSQEPLLPTAAGDEAPMAGYQPAPAYEHLGDLPPTYGSQSVYLVAYDPRQLFAYWDVDPAKSGISYGLRLCRGDGEVESEFTINALEAGRYLPAGVPGGTYYVELGTTGRAGRWRPLGFSGRVTMPPAGLAGEVETKFATLPFHLSFQRLLELIQDAMGQGENLAAALARLQAGDRQGLDLLVGTLATLTQEQLQTLERLLGQHVSPATDAGSSFGGASENSALASGARGSETFSSGAFGAVSSETFGSAIAPSRAESGTVTSGVVFGRETLSSASFGRAELAASVSSAGETLTSGGAAFGSETLASGAAAFGSETLASGAAALGSENLSSGELGFGSETLTSGALAFGSESWSSLGLSESSLELLQALGVSSGAWSLASGGLGLGSESLASGPSAQFFHELEGNLAELTSMFSWAAASLSSDFLSSESGASGSV
jgi:hypothetical protein